MASNSFHRGDRVRVTDPETGETTVATVHRADDGYSPRIQYGNNQYDRAEPTTLTIIEETDDDETE